MGLQVGAAFAAMVAVRLTWLRLRPAEMRDATPRYARREWLAACLPMGMTEGLRLLEGQSAVLMLGLLASLPDVGIYRVADAVAAAQLWDPQRQLGPGCDALFEQERLVAPHRARVGSRDGAARLEQLGHPRRLDGVQRVAQSVDPHVCHVA